MGEGVMTALGMAARTVPVILKDKMQHRRYYKDENENFGSVDKSGQHYTLALMAMTMTVAAETFDIDGASLLPYKIDDTAYGKADSYRGYYFKNHYFGNDRRRYA